MDPVERLVGRYYRKRSHWRRNKRLLFPSPAETKLIELMGGKVLKLRPLRDRRTHFAMAIVLTRGKFLRAERMRREVRVGRYYIDLGNDLKRGIEIDGLEYHTDVVADFDREVYVRERGWRLLRIPARDLYRQPEKVVAKVQKFLG